MHHDRGGVTYASRAAPHRGRVTAHELPPALCCTAAHWPHMPEHRALQDSVVQELRFPVQASGTVSSAHALSSTLCPSPVLLPMTLPHAFLPMTLPHAFFQSYLPNGALLWCL